MDTSPVVNASSSSVARTMVADGKGILAADERVPTLTRRFDTLGIKSTEPKSAGYREMLFTSPDAAEFISGVVMYDETIRQKSSRGMLRTKICLLFIAVPVAIALRALGNIRKRWSWKRQR